MDEQELEEWFHEQKEALEEAFQKAVQEHLNDPEHVKASYDTKYRKLIATYQKKEEQLYVHEQRMAAINKPATRFFTWMRETRQRPGRWFRKQKKTIGKWLFDIKFRWTVLR